MKDSANGRSNHEWANLVYRMKISKLEMDIQLPFLFIVMMVPWASFCLDSLCWGGLHNFKPALGKKPDLALAHTYILILHQ